MPFIALDLHLSPLAMGAVLSAFFVGYSVMQIPGGVLADRFGINRVMTASIVGWSVFTALTGTATSLMSMLIVRMVFGLSEGPFPPAASKTVALWFPQREIGRANGIQLAAVNIGAAIAPLFAAPLIATLGWRSVFYSLLTPGLLLAIVVAVFIKQSPVHAEQDPRQAEMGETEITVMQALNLPAVRACSVTLFFANIATWGLMNWLPTYLLRERDFGVVKTGLFTSLPFVAGALGFYLGGYIADKYFSRRRHIPIVIGLIISGSMSYCAVAAPTGEWAIAAMVFVFLSLFIALSGLFTVPLLIVPRESVGRVFGIVNTVGQIAAVVSPLFIGYVLTVSNGKFNGVFYCLIGLFVTSAYGASRIKHSYLPSEPPQQSAISSHR